MLNRRAENKQNVETFTSGEDNSKSPQEVWHQINDLPSVKMFTSEKDTGNLFFVGDNVTYPRQTDLEIIVTRLETVCDKLEKMSFRDSFDEFGKYIASLLRGIPTSKAVHLKQEILESVLITKSSGEDNRANSGLNSSEAMIDTSSVHNSKEKVKRTNVGVLNTTQKKPPDSIFVESASHRVHEINPSSESSTFNGNDVQTMDPDGISNNENLQPHVSLTPEFEILESISSIDKQNIRFPEASFKIEIEEGNELIKLKQEQIPLFESVICSEDISEKEPPGESHDIDIFLTQVCSDATLHNNQPERRKKRCCKPQTNHSESLLSTKEHLIKEFVRRNSLHSGSRCGFHYLSRSPIFTGEGRDRRRFRRSCNICYQVLQRTMGRKKSKNMAKVTTYCATCQGNPYFCEECFISTHKNSNSK